MIDIDSLMLYRSFVNYSLFDVGGNIRTADNSIQELLRSNFYESIYMPRADIEKIISAWIKIDNSELGVVVGAQGSGKSTMIRKLVDQLDVVNYPRIILDMSNIYPDVEKDMEKGNSNTWKKRVDEEIEDNIVQKYFDGGYYDFLIFILFGGHTELQSRIRKNISFLESLYAQYQRENIGRSKIMSLGEWFKEFRSDKDVYQQVVEVSNKINVICCVKSIYLLNRQYIKHLIIVLDNVDRVPNKYQKYMYEMANDLQEQCMGLANIIICTRKETAHPPDHITGIRSRTFIQFGVYGEENNNHHLDQYAFNALLKKRNVFFLDAATKGLIKLNPQAAYQYIHISEQLEDVYATTVLINIANQSIRDALKYHSEFIAYLLNEYEYTKLALIMERQEVRPLFLLSALFGFITKYSDILTDQCVNLVRLVQSCKQMDYMGIAGCDLSYLILVSIYNHKKWPRSRPIKITDIYEKFKLFSDSVDEGLIKSNIFELYKLRSQDFGYILNIIQQNIPSSMEEIDDDSTLELTFRGEVLIKTVSVSFTFINRLLYDMEIDSFYDHGSTKIVGSYYDMERMPRHAYNQARFLSEVAFMHTLELHRIRTRINRPDWYDLYLKLFSVDKKLQLQRIIESNIKHLSCVSELSTMPVVFSGDIKVIIEYLRTLLSLYLSEVKNFNLDNIADTKILDYKKIFRDYYGNKYKGVSLEDYKNIGFYNIDISNKL